MMFVSMVGQAIFHTALKSGPSTIERSKRDAAGAGDVGDVSGGVAALAAAGVVLNRTVRVPGLHPARATAAAHRAPGIHQEPYAGA